MVIISMILADGCGKPSAPSGGTVSAEGKLALIMEGKEVTCPLEVMDVFLVEDEGAYPETFYLKGTGVELAGSFPKDCHVGYGEEWSRILNKTITVEKKANPGGEGEIKSHITVSGSVLEIEDGSLTVEKIAGRAPNGAGTVLEGKITLSVKGKTIEGTFRVLAKTWG